VNEAAGLVVIRLDVKLLCPFAVSPFWSDCSAGYFCYRCWPVGRNGFDWLTELLILLLKKKAQLPPIRYFSVYAA
jgi:hypothetical protein